MILYEGPSMLDGSPIVVVATGFNGSANRKTGDVLQVWIIRADMDPMAASKARLDDAICGTCPHRRSLGGACYVTLHQAPRSVYAAFKRGSYDHRTVTRKGVKSRLPVARPTVAEMPAIFAGRTIRLGAYGDPAAVPLYIWEAITSQADSHLGYTHQWRTQSSTGLGRFCMASVDTSAEHDAATAAGWRTFRVRQSTEPVKAGEFVCPASEEAGKRRSCADCGACDGSVKPGRFSPVIMAHGTLTKRFVVIQNRLNA